SPVLTPRLLRIVQTRKSANRVPSVGLRRPAVSDVATILLGRIGRTVPATTSDRDVSRNRGARTADRPLSWAELDERAGAGCCQRAGRPLARPGRQAQPSLSAAPERTPIAALPRARASTRTRPPPAPPSARGCSRSTHSPPEVCTRLTRLGRARNAHGRYY